MIMDFDDKYELETYSAMGESAEKGLFKAIHEAMLLAGIKSGYTLGAPDSGGEGGLCLHQDGRFFVVYASERGERINPAFFTSGRDAANFMVWMKCRKHEQFPRVRLV